MTKSTKINNTGRIKLIVSDLDGTLLNRQHRIPKSNRAAVLELKDKGIRFTFATGRVDYMTREFARQLEIDEPIISCNGAMVRNINTNEILTKNLIDPADARQILRYFNSLDFDILAYEKNRICHAKTSVRVEFFHLYNRLAAEGGTEQVVLHPFDKVEETFHEGQEFLKLFIWQPDAEKLQAATDHLHERYPNLYFVRSAVGSLDITAKGTTKGSGVTALAEHYGYSTDEVAVFGDQENDLPMFERSGISFAMGNSSQKILQAADVVLLTNDQSGLGQGIRKYFL